MCYCNCFPNVCGSEKPPVSRHAILTLLVFFPLSHRRREDCFGPYFPQYEHWFGKGVVRGRDFAGKRVCFSALGWAPSIPENHVWRFFNEASTCDVPSPLFKQYVQYMMERWNLHNVIPRAYRDDECNNAALGAVASGGAVAVVPATCKPFVRVLYVLRKKKPFNAAPIQDRVIANDNEFIEGLKRGGSAFGVDVEVDPVDFTGMPFEDQLRRVRASHIVVGMHGAGMVHGIHLSPKDACNGPAAAIELFPAGHGQKGIEHLVNYAGHKYLRWSNNDATRETGSGTMVDIPAIMTLTSEAVRHVVTNRDRVCPPPKRA